MSNKIFTKEEIAILSKNNMPRAHSVVILNNADNGVPEAIINTPKLSILRTAGVTGSIIKAFNKARVLKNANVGIIEWGPIGQHHFKMVTDLLGDKIDNVFLYDLNPIDTDDVVMFNPMGMAAFDVALGSYFLNKAVELGIGQQLE